ncbi:MAG: hypothetical protein ACP5RI_02380 [Candidatus Micrarchaeia archaeon]
MEEENKNRLEESIKVQTKSKRAKIKRISRIQKYYLIPYQENTDLGKLAEDVIEMDGVQEVGIGDSENDDDKGYGIIIKTKHSKEVDSEEFAHALGKKIKGRCMKIVSYYSIKK